VDKWCPVKEILKIFSSILCQDIIRPFEVVVFNMNIRETSVEQESPDPFTQLNQVADGYIVVGYLKDTHDKFAQFYATDRACNDALAFFHAPVNEWMQFMESDQCKQEKT